MTGIIPGGIAAYQNASKLTSNEGATNAAASLGENSVGTFADLVKGGVEGAIETTKAGENVTAQYLQGNADITDVVLAVRNAEATINTITAIRDRVVNSIQEIMRMAI